MCLQLTCGEDSADAAYLVGCQPLVGVEAVSLEGSVGTLYAHERVAVDLMGRLIPEELIRSETGFLDRRYVDITVELPELLLPEIDGRVAGDGCDLMHVVVEFHEFKPVREPPVGTFGLVVHEP